MPSASSRRWPASRPWPGPPCAGRGVHGEGGDIPFPLGIGAAVPESEARKERRGNMKGTEGKEGKEGKEGMEGREVMEVKEVKGTLPAGRKSASGRPKARIPVALEDRDWRGECGIVVPIFDEAVTLFVGSEEDLFRYHGGTRNGVTLSLLANVRTAPRVEGRKRAATYWHGASAMIVLPEIDLGDGACVSSLYHEALHVALLTLDRTGAEVGRYGETLAYLQSYIVDSLVWNLRNGLYGTLLPDGTKVGARGRADGQMAELAKIIRDAGGRPAQKQEGRNAGNAHRTGRTH